MGLIAAALNAAGGTLASQWKEYFYVDALPDNVLATKAEKKVKGRFGGSRHEDDNVISDGSVIAVADGQCMMIVDQGKIMDFCAEPGEYVFQQNGEPSIFYGALNGEKAKAILKTTFDRLSFGGQAGKNQRVYFFNTKEILGNKYGTPSPVPFRVVDNNIGLDVDISIRCFGEYSYRIVNPILFYTNVAGNDVDVYERSRLDSQLKSELLTALQPAFARISALHIDYSQLPGHTPELAQALNEVLSPKWRDLRGIEIVSIGINSVKANEEDEEKIQKAQMGLTMSRPDIGLGTLVDATADSMRTAAANEGGMGAAMGYMGMNMANQAGAGLAQELAARQAAQAPSPMPQAAPAGSWTCPAVSPATRGTSARPAAVPNRRPPLPGPARNAARPGIRATSAATAARRGPRFRPTGPARPAGLSIRGISV